MKIFVKVKPNAKKEKIERLNGDHFAVSVKDPPREGRANKAVIRALAAHLRLPLSRLAIVSGQRSKEKIVEIS